MTVLLLCIDTALAIPRGGGDSVNTPLGGGKKVKPSYGKSDIVVERECIEGETNESVRSGEIIADNEKKAFLRKRLFDVAKSLFGRAADVILSKTSLRRPNDDSGNDDGVDHTFDDLDLIIENSNTTINDELLKHQHLRVVDDGEEYDDDEWLLKTFWPPLAQGSSLLSGRKQQRSLLHRMNKVRNIENSLLFISSNPN
jgi:hypothetical protein